MGAIPVNVVSFLVVTDIKMPEMTGVGLLEKMGDSGVCLPVVVMTGYCDGTGIGRLNPDYS